jgi:hypothetical protein
LLPTFSQHCSTYPQGAAVICAAPASIGSFHFFSFPFSRAVLGGNQKQNFQKPRFSS